MAGGQTVGKYELEGVFGKGGMGKVYKARDTSLKRTVALKVILAGAHADERDLNRFKSEAEAIARLKHANIVQIYEVGEHDGMPFISLEFCPGGSLDKKLDGTPLPPKDAAQLVATLARAMYAAHQAQVIHRDLKPANILLQHADLQTTTASEVKAEVLNLRALVPKITDFGLAKMLDDVGQTQSGAIMGTPSYMAPEQAEGKSKSIGPSADIYALGAILYQLLTGRPPFKAATPMDTIKQVITDEPVAPRALQPKVPVDLETVCVKCLQKEPGKRYGTAQELADDLGRFIRGEPVRARPVSTPERFWRWCRRNPRVAILAVGVFLVVALWAATATFLTWRLSDEIDQKEKATLEANGNATLAKDNEKEAVKNLKTAKENLKTAVNNAQMAMQQFGRLGLRMQGSLLADGQFHEMGPAGNDLRATVYKALNVALEKTAAETADAFGGNTSRFAQLALLQQKGDISKKLGQGEQAQIQINEGYGLAKRIAENLKGLPESDKARGNWGMMAKRLGDITLEIYCAPLIARSAYKKGRALQESVYKDPQSDTYDEATNKVLLSHHDVALGIAELQLGHPAVARAHFQEALTFREVWAESKNTATARAQAEARSFEADACLWLGRACWHAGDPEGATDALERSVNLYEALLKEYPVFWYQIDMAYILAGRAEAQLRLGKPALASESYRQAEKYLLTGMAKASYEPSHEHLLATIYEEWGTAARKAGQPAETDKHYQDALKLRMELVDIEPSNRTWRAAYCVTLAHAGKTDEAVREADQMSRPPKGVPLPLLLQAARCYAVCAAAAIDPAQKKRHVDSALGALRTATAGDYEDAVALRTDPDFESLNADPGFTAIVDEVAQRAGKR